MGKAELRVFPSPDAIGEYLAPLLLQHIESRRLERKRFHLGCPTGRTPRPIYSAMARWLAEKPQDLSHLVLVMMDEYLVSEGGRFENAAPERVRRFLRLFAASFPPRLSVEKLV
jgi:glucosamine-6-phosphate deaminase